MEGNRFQVARFLITTLALIISCGVVVDTWAQVALRERPTTAGFIDLQELTRPQSEMRTIIERYIEDLGILSRVYPIEISPTRSTRFRRFYTEWLDALGRLDFKALSQEGRIDYLLFKNHLDYQFRQLDIRAKALEEMAPLIPFAQAIIDLEETRRRMEPVKPSKAAALLSNINKQIDSLRKGLEASSKPESKLGGIKIKKTVANRAAETVKSLRNTLKNWFGFYNGYDPVFTWWVESPYKTLDQTLEQYSAFLREKIVGVKPDDKEAIIGDPIGREALMSELAHEMIAYTPEELIELAWKEFAWCENEMRRASRELGYGDDWKKALEYVKTLHVEPGKQPELVRDLALEAIKFLEERDLLTIPPLARETWRMEMLSPEEQLVSPFFLGGEVIRVAFPTNTMTHEQKMMTMRGNNIHFSRAVVHHELIPGHHLQGFMRSRYQPHRRLFNTPFWVEGWALYWELLLWDLNFPKSPEDRIGMLFWRMHRCSRIIFSLSFHLEKMSPQECIDFLVKRVGHEPENAEAEVRRSFGGHYSPLYQAAYLLGGLQLRALHRELVESGKMTNRAFHDAILLGNTMPIEMVRARLTNQELGPNFKPTWRFYQLK